MKMPQTLNTGRFCKRSRHLTFYFCQFSCMFIFSTTSAQRVGLSLFARSSLFFRFSLSTSIHISSVYSFACLMIRWFGVKLCVLHVFFELVLHVSVRTGSSRHAQINRFTFFQAERKKLVENLNGWTGSGAHLIQIIYLIWFHNDIFVDGYF